MLDNKRAFNIGFIYGKRILGFQDTFSLHFKCKRCTYWKRDCFPIARVMGSPNAGPFCIKIIYTNVVNVCRCGQLLLSGFVFVNWTTDSQCTLNSAVHPEV